MTLAEVLSDRKVVVCCGTGGVGKTTTAAALGVAAAKAGRRTALVTIDPARRLADALGLGHLGGRALANATNCCTDFTGSDG